MVTKRSKTSAVKASRAICALRFLVQLRLLRTVLLVSLCLAFWVALNYGNLREMTIAKEERDEMRAQLIETRAHLEAMRQRSLALRSDRGALERAAREQYRMTYPGEVLVLLEREPAHH
jgi:cell division protein FtsB